MAKISIDTIQPAGASLFADDESFISELSDHEMQVAGGSKKNRGGQNFNFGLILDPCFGGYQVGAFLNFGGGGGTKSGKGGGAPGFSLAIPLGGRPACPPYGFGGFPGYPC
jgi:hypothetical protein